MWVKSLSRTAKEGDDEVLTLRTGVNLLVGHPNTGKSSWVRALDYLFGDSSSPSRALKRNVAQKFESVRAVLSINGEDLSLERGWGEGFVQGKILVDGVPVDQSDFSDVLLPKLGLPLLRVPQGNPYSSRTWPRLSWRDLYRHVYRNENSWTDIADRQPQAQQFASLMVLLGAGEQLFPAAFGNLVEVTKKKLFLEGKREQYVATLEEVTRDLVSIREASVALTADSITRAKERVSASINALENDRKQLLERLRIAIDPGAGASPREQSRFEVDAAELAESRATREQFMEAMQATRKRIAEIKRLQAAAAEEAAKLSRLKTASEILADLKVTHCPHCDQVINANRSTPANTCYVCLQPHAENTGDQKAGLARVDFEENQLQSELRELAELANELAGEEAATARDIRDIDDRISTLESKLAPVQARAALVLPPELTLIDQERGQLTEQLRQLERVGAALNKRDDLASSIDELNREIAALEAQVKTEQKNVPFDRLATSLANHMNEYLNALNLDGDPRWVAGRVTARLSGTALTLFINGNHWVEVVGATNACYFLVAYNYALLAMTGEPGNLYPGLCIIDLPANMSDVKVLKDQENYLIEPFVRLLGDQRYKECQLIAVGHAYHNVPHANRIEFSNVYAAPEVEATEVED